MLAWASASECDGRHGAFIASPSSGLLSLMRGSGRIRATRQQLDRPGFFHPLPVAPVTKMIRSPFFDTSSISFDTT
jgi:hypothetical protein